MTHIDKWAQTAYENSGNEGPWDALPESSRIIWREFIEDVIVDRIREVR